MVSGTSSRIVAWIATFAIAVAPAAAIAKVFHTQEEALALAFPDADEVRSETRILSEEQAERIRRLSRSDLDTEIIKLHTGFRDGELVGYAYIDIHTVRTMPEAFLVVLTPEGTVRSLRVLAFYEPLDYLPTDRWYAQFDGKGSGEPLRVGRDIQGILGATLSARAVSASVRRVQAFFEVLVRSAKPTTRDVANVTPE